jgi:hypothetical protein
MTPKAIAAFERILQDYPRLDEDMMHDVLLVVAQQLHLGVSLEEIFFRIRQPTFAVIRGERTVISE